MALRWTQRGRRQLLKLTREIAEERPIAAKRLARRIRDTTAAIGKNPLSGRMVPEFGEPSVRERLVSPYRLIYSVQGMDVFVLALYHGRRLLPQDIEDL